MKIGEVAQQARVSKSIIRYYEGKGVLPRALRDHAGYREYGNTDLSRIRLITGLRRLGCSFKDIRDIMQMVDQHLAPSCHILDLLAHKKVEVRNEIERLMYIQSELSPLLDLAVCLAGEGALTTLTLYQKTLEPPPGSP